MKKLMIFMSAALLLSSCGLYNKYERPEVKTDGIVRDPVSLTDTLAVQDTTSFGNMPWRTVFTDPQLQTLIQQGLDNNPDLLNAALNVKMINEALKVARLAFLPSLVLSPQGTLASFDGAKASKTYQLPVSASWNVDLFGNLLSAKRSAQMQLIATKDYQTVVKTNIISGIANLYYTLLMLDRQVEIVTDMEQLTKDTWEKMKFMHENRIGYRSTAVQSAEAAYYSVQAQKVDLLRQVRECENSSRCSSVSRDRPSPAEPSPDRACPPTSLRAWASSCSTTVPTSTLPRWIWRSASTMWRMLAAVSIRISRSRVPQPSPTALVALSSIPVSGSSLPSAHWCSPSSSTDRSWLV